MRFHLLTDFLAWPYTENDRKANMEVLEANKGSNKEEIRRLREDGKEFRQKLAVLMKTAAIDDEKDEEKHVSREVSKLRKNYDEVRLRSARVQKSLEELRDSAKDLELDSQRPHMEDNEYTRSIRALENKLDKAMIKYNEAQSIRKTYEQIVRRLKEERVGFDNQLAAIERTLGAKQRDYDELLLLSGDASHAKETALGEKDRVLAAYEDERKRREKELREKHQVVQLRKQMLERMRHREKMRNDLLTNNGELDDMSMLTSNAQKQLQIDKIEARNKVDVFEIAFRKIKEATGVSDVNEVIQKITSQESSMENLVALTKENQAKMESLNELRRQIKTKVDEVKYSGVGGGHRRKLVDDHEDQLANSSARLERTRLKYERLSKVIISMKGGVGHLQEKLEPVRDELGGRLVDLTDDTVAEVLRECELCLANVLRRVETSADVVRKSKLSSMMAHTYSTLNAAGAGVESGREVEGGFGASAQMDSALRPFNQRIELSLDDEEGTYRTNKHAEDDYSGIDDDEELTREKVKRASSQILSQIDRKKRKPKKKGMGDFIED